MGKIIYEFPVKKVQKTKVDIPNNYENGKVKPDSPTEKEYGEIGGGKTFFQR